MSEGTDANAVALPAGTDANTGAIARRPHAPLALPVACSNPRPLPPLVRAGIAACCTTRLRLPTPPAASSDDECDSDGNAAPGPTRAGKLQLARVAHADTHSELSTFRPAGCPPDRWLQTSSHRGAEPESQLKQVMESGMQQLVSGRQKDERVSVSASGLIVRERNQGDSRGRVEGRRASCKQAGVRAIMPLWCHVPGVAAWMLRRVSNMDTLLSCRFACVQQGHLAFVPLGIHSPAPRKFRKQDTIPCRPPGAACSMRRRVAGQPSRGATGPSCSIAHACANAGSSGTSAKPYKRWQRLRPRRSRRRLQLAQSEAAHGNAAAAPHGSVAPFVQVRSCGSRAARRQCAGPEQPERAFDFPAGSSARAADGRALSCMQCVRLARPAWPARRTLDGYFSAAAVRSSSRMSRSNAPGVRRSSVVTLDPDPRARRVRLADLPPDVQRDMAALGERDPAEAHARLREMLGQADSARARASRRLLASRIRHVRSSAVAPARALSLPPVALRAHAVCLRDALANSAAASRMRVRRFA